MECEEQEEELIKKKKSKINHKENMKSKLKDIDQTMHSYREFLPKMKAYPKKDPDAVEMLMEYTIWPEIKIYSTFLEKINYDPELKENIIKGKEQVPRCQIQNHRLTAFISVALEAERVLKHVYVNW